MAMTGDPVIAYPNTLTGSIGVISAKLNLRALYDKVGVQKDILSRGRFAEMDTDYRPMTETERAKFRESIEATYRGFVSRVAAGRKKKYDEVEPLAQGRVWLGSQAKKNGLIDELGGLDRAVEMVRQKAKIPADQNIVLVPYPPKRSLFDVLMSRPDEASVIEIQARRLAGSIPGAAWIAAAFNPHPQMLSPVHIDVR